jgi:hypothetical protein
VTELRSHAAEFEKAGAGVAVVGNGWPAAARAFGERVQLPPSIRLFTDKSQAAYRAAGLRRGIWRTLGPHAWLPFLRTLLRGFRQRRTAGDPWQQGGAVVVAKGGEVVFRHVSEHPGDQAPAASLLAAVTSRRAP